MAEAGASLDEIVTRVSAVTKAMGMCTGPDPCPQPHLCSSTVPDKRHQHRVNFSTPRTCSVPGTQPPSCLPIQPPTCPTPALKSGTHPFLPSPSCRHSGAQLVAMQRPWLQAHLPAG